ncbi:hypothetical protein AMS68_004556 [Peltaster fructicola]|uniref:Myb-like domain-containing protein n=1 Tax=Peltaster fructicola TaxID=286661 RepID=A0A6H0XWP6_9PEZI|nr:hypothetical protein AMS68_004556 [Peltaster fructicola]
MPKTWSESEDRRLLLAIIQTVAPNITTANWSTVAAMLDNGSTASACMQHFNKKLKTGSITDDGNTATTPQSAKSKSSKATPSNKRKNIEEIDDENSDVDYKSPKEHTKTKSSGAGSKRVKAEEAKVEEKHYEDEDEVTIKHDASE